MSFDFNLCHFFTCSLLSFNDMSKHSLVLWLLLLLLWVLGWVFLGGGCYVLFENFVLWKTCNVNVLKCYYVVTIICACLCNEDRLED